MIRKRVLTSKYYNPMWTGPLEGYVKNHLHKNYWKVESHMEYQDTLQEAYLLFLKLKEKYSTVETPQHFMALYKTSWANKFTDFANTDTALRQLECLYPQSDELTVHESESFNDHASETDNDGMLAVMIEQAPTEIKLVLDLFLKTPIEVLEQLTHIFEDRKHPADFNNKHLCKILGLESGTDIKEKIYAYFSINHSITKHSK